MVVTQQWVLILMVSNMNLKLYTTGRIIGSFLIVTAYYVVLHVSSYIGSIMYLTANAISLPFFIRTKGYDVVVMLTFLMVISLSKILT